VGAQPEADVVGAEGEALDLDGHEGLQGADGAEAGAADGEVVLRLVFEAVGQERGVVDGAAGLQDQVLQQQVDFRHGDLETWDRDVLDCLDEEGDQDRVGVGEEFWVRLGVGRGEDLPDF